MGEVVNYLGVRLEDVIDQLSFYNGKELNDSPNSKIFAKTFRDEFGGVDGEATKGAIQMDRDYKLGHINRLFDENIELMHCLMIDIVENKYKGNWLIFVNLYRRGLSDSFTGSELDRIIAGSPKIQRTSDLTLQDLKIMIDNGDTKNPSITLDVKADYINLVSNEIDWAFKNPRKWWW